MRILQAVALIALVCGLSPHRIAAQEVRLLPKSFVAEMRSTWKQDGRAIDAVVSNPKGQWVVTEVALEVTYRSEDTANPLIPNPPPVNKARQKGPNFDAGERFISQLQQKETLVKPVQILPGRSASLALELRPGQEVVTLFVVEARGRDPTTLERLKAKLP